MSTDAKIHNQAISMMLQNKLYDIKSMIVMNLNMYFKPLVIKKSPLIKEDIYLQKKYYLNDYNSNLNSFQNQIKISNQQEYKKIDELIDKLNNENLKTDKINEKTENNNKELKTDKINNNINKELKVNELKTDKINKKTENNNKKLKTDEINNENSNKNNKQKININLKKSKNLLSKNNLENNSENNNSENNLENNNLENNLEKKLITNPIINNNEKKVKLTEINKKRPKIEKKYINKVKLSENQKINHENTKKIQNKSSNINCKINILNILQDRSNCLNSEMITKECINMNYNENKELILNTLVNCNNVDNMNITEEYSKWISSIFNEEFLINETMAFTLNNKKNIVKEIIIDLSNFNRIFHEFYNVSMMIEKEMASFNANPRYYTYEVEEMTANAKYALKIIDILEDLNYGDENVGILKEVFMKEKPNNIWREDDLKRIKSKICLSIIKAIIIIEIIIGVILGLYIYLEIRGINIIKGTLLGFFLINICFGIYLIVLAHIVDKKCIIGNVDNCKMNFSTEFVKFAAKTNLYIDGKEKTGQIQEFIDNVDIKTQKIIELTKSLLIEDYVEKFKYKSMVLQELFDKILFIKEEFNELTGNKVNKEKFITNIINLNNILEKIKKNLKIIDKKELFDFYTKQIIFSNFLSREKIKIYNSIGLEITNEVNNFNDTKICIKKKNRICKMKRIIEKLSILFIFGSLIISGLLVF